ncbi:MAG TPA: 6-phosphogluconolactonase [Candidatus Binatia bacterium]|jgi:6-phosphogluconolactonase
MLQFTEREVIICRDVNELNRKAAQQFIALAGEAISQTGRFTVALSGGSTPKGLYASLATPEYRNRVDWSRVHLFWGDERCVPPDHPESNFRMVQESLLSKIQIPFENVHRMMGEKEPEQAATEYEEHLRQFFHLPRGGVPRFDLIFLGLGEDGHTGSLFPDTAALNEKEHLVATVYVEKLKAHRLTLTLPVINAAARIIFLVTGQSKSTVVNKLLSADSKSQNYPATKVSPANGHVTWLMTQDAARELSAR